MRLEGLLAIAAVLVGIIVWIIATSRRRARQRAQQREREAWRAHADDMIRAYWVQRIRRERQQPPSEPPI